MDERRVIHEITPLMGNDVLYIADRRKKEFTYPIHNHEAFELNFVEHAAGNATARTSGKSPCSLTSGRERTRSSPALRSYPYRR